jgi:hypothetical protein
LAFEGPGSKYTDAFTVDAFLEGRDNIQFSIEISKLEPINLDEAVKQALRLESYSCMGRSHDG